MDERRFFQWVVGDRKGEVLIFDKIETDEENVYIVFKDGSRINETLVAPLNQKDLTGKYMAEVDSPTNVWSFKEEWVGRQEEKWETNAEGISVCVVPFIPGRKVIHLIPPKKTPPKSSNFGQITNIAPPPPPPQPVSAPIESVIEKNTNIDKNDPVYILMSKSKKVETEIEMIMTVSLPSKSLYEIAKTSFDEGDIKFIDYIVDEMSTDEIKTALKDALKQMYEEPKEQNDE